MNAERLNAGLLNALPSWLAPWLAAVAVVMAIAALLWIAQRHLRIDGNPIVDEINAVLPQTQCGQCLYPGCRPYAEAIASGEAAINQCPPGGDDGVAAIAALLGVEPIALNAEHGDVKPPQVALIIEELCIGCTKCIDACPVDAIIGANKLMHTVIEAQCTGCELCIAPCPVDCIELLASSTRPRRVLA